MVKNKVRYILFFLFVLILFAGFNGRTLFLMLVVLVVMPFITLSQTKRMLNKMEITVSFDKLMTGRNAENNMFLTVNNKVHLPSAGVTLNVVLANSFYDEEKSIKVDIPINGYGDSSVQMSIKAENCGNIYVKSVMVTAMDLLSLHRFSKKKEADAKYMVIPSYIYAPSDKATLKIEDDSEIVKHEAGEDTSEIESIREYLPGDRMQRIHWKLTGKMEEMMVKEYAINYDIDVSLVCELYKDEAHECLDELMDALYSLMIELCDSNERYSFYFSNKSHDGVMASSITSREDVFDTIGQMYYIKPCDQPQLAATFAKAAGVDSAMVLRWRTDSEDEDKLLYEFGDKVVLAWE